MSVFNRFLSMPLLLPDVLSSDVIGTNIKRKRLKAGFSIRAFSKLTNIPRATLFDIENNNQYFNKPTLEKIAIALNCTIVDFLAKPLTYY